MATALPPAPTPKRYGCRVDAVVVPEPDEEEREALLAAIAAEAGDANNAWRQAALREATEAEEP